MKTCTKCNIEYPATAEFFHQDKGHKDGLQYWCKFCRSRYRATINGHLRHVFSNMKQRCYNPKDSHYKYYGGKGIKVYWKTSDEFIDYVINKLQIDRIDNAGDYEPDNIRFVTAKENCQNRG